MRRKSLIWAAAGFIVLGFGWWGYSMFVKDRFALYTHCGVDELHAHGHWYERVGGPLQGPPKGWGNPEQVGKLTVHGTTATFTDRAGHHETFKERVGATGPKNLCS